MLKQKLIFLILKVHLWLHVECSKWELLVELEVVILDNILKHLLIGLISIGERSLLLLSLLLLRIVYVWLLSKVSKLWSISKRLLRKLAYSCTKLHLLTCKPSLLLRSLTCILSIVWRLCPIKGLYRLWLCKITLCLWLVAKHNKFIFYKISSNCFIFLLRPENYFMLSKLKIYQFNPLWHL